MKQENYQNIMNKIDKLEYNARFECGSYIQELIYYVKQAVVEANESESDN